MEILFFGGVLLLFSCLLCGIYLFWKIKQTDKEIKNLLKESARIIAYRQAKERDYDKTPGK